MVYNTCFSCFCYIINPLKTLRRSVITNVVPLMNAIVKRYLSSLPIKMSWARSVAVAQTRRTGISKTGKITYPPRMTLFQEAKTAKRILAHFSLLSLIYVDIFKKHYFSKLYVIKEIADKALKKSWLWIST